VAGVPVAQTFTLDLAPSTSVRYVLEPGDTIGSMLYWTGVKEWEREVVPVFVEEFRKGPVRRFLDVGCHSGVYTIVACALDRHVQVESFEPVPALVNRIKRNVAVNKIGQRVTIHAVAVSDADGIIALHVPEDLTMCSLSERYMENMALKSTIINIPAVCLDSRGYTDVDFMKIDVECAEHLILRGARELIDRCRPRILFECFDSPPAPPRQWENVLAELPSYYRLRSIPDTKWNGNGRPDFRVATNFLAEPIA